ncbi:hypothetical protein [Pseudomonas putida]
MSQDSTSDGQSQTSKQGTVAVVYHQAVQCYFRPETEELVFLASDEAGKFENHWRDMQAGISAFHQAQVGYSSALEAYGVAMRTGLSAQQQDNHDIAISDAEKELEETRQAIQQRLGDFSQQDMSYDDVVELIPVVGQNTKRRKGSKPARYVYVKKGYFSESSKGRRLHSVSLKSRDSKTGEQSVIGKDRHGRNRIDVQKLHQQLTDLQWPKLKLELKDVLKWSGFDPEDLTLDTTLFDWAQSWNDSAQGKTELGANVDVSGGAQFMRFVSNVGASAEFDPGNRQASFKSEGKASLAIATGTVDLKAYIPDRLGWSLAYAHREGQVFDMGQIRLVIAPELSGFIGASVMLEGQLQVVIQGDKQLLAGQPGGRLPRFHERRTRGAVFHQQMSAEDEGLNLSGEAFAGARVQGGLKGSLQWMKPAEPIDPDSWVAGMLTSSGAFTDFCSIGGSVSAMAGAGLGGKFRCTFINGRFCFHVAASLCLGVGAKGTFLCEVGVGMIAEFGGWLVYQLYRLNFSFFDLVSRDAFGVYSKYCVLQLSGVKDDRYGRYVHGAGLMGDVAEVFVGYIRSLSDEGWERVESSKRRNILATNTISRRKNLLKYTPEAKGILIFLLTRHGKWDKLDLGNRGGVFMVDMFKDRKEAVLWVLRSIQTRAEWRKVLSHMTAEGSSLATSLDEAVVEEEQEKKLVSFLQLGLNRDEELYKAKAEIVDIRKRLKTEVSVGYALAMNDTNYYRLNWACNPHFPRHCDFGFGGEHNWPLA